MVLTNVTFIGLDKLIIKLSVFITWVEIIKQKHPVSQLKSLIQSNKNFSQWICSIFSD